ncbi:MAG: preprotein translocase subunit SecE [Clostridia bacterium]|nr:preprotein translocase subunit SecE [Clostridia bacterium]MBR2398018.1 preprotein translocase subunit SecE [Clostridia bacterium]MBR2496555.1 preprotein translocase subunit SecE [Clostridia bacterium]MBR2875143.1 preprotein translocase subunit SecE [Clostridia bacterium]
MANEINKNSAEVDNTELVALEDQAKGKKAVEEAKAENKEVSKKAKKVKKNKKSFGKKIKEIFSELKKVSWPSFGKVVKQTGIVIAVVLFFLIVIGVADIGLGALYKLLIG